MPRLANPLKKLRRHRNQVDSGSRRNATKPRKRHHYDDGSVNTADTTLSGRSTASPCEDLGYLIGDAAVTLLDGFAAVMNCCNDLIIKPNHSSGRSCCTTVTWGPDEVRYMEEETSLNAEEAQSSNMRLVEMKSGNDHLHERERSPSPEWENFDHFEQESIEVWSNDTETEEQQKMIDAAFSADFSDFSSFIANPDVSIEETSVKSSNTNTSSFSTGKKKRACTCCGKSNKKESPVKLKVCSRCKTAFYCSAECQKVGL